MKFFKYPLFFAIGGLGYVGLELLWRGRSHIAMFLAGGVCFLLLGQIRRLSWPVYCQCLAGACAITAVELAVGLLFNRGFAIWDYRAMPANLMGQICLPFTLLWVPVSFGGLLLYGWLDSRLEKLSV